MAEVKDYSADALLRKEKEVELDTDDVKEETVELKEETPKEKEPNLNVGEVDLGYTDHPKKEEKKEEDTSKPNIEIVEETQPEVSRETSDNKEEKKEEEKPDLQEHNRNYQKRIDKLVYKAKEAERREQAALEYATGLKKKFETSDMKFQEKDEAYLKELDARVDAQREQVKVAMKAAMEAQDPAKLVEANDKLTQLAVEKEKARLELANREQLKKPHLDHQL